MDLDSYQLICESLNNNYIILYYLSPVSNLESIKKNGLQIKHAASHYQKGFWRTIMPGIYLATNKEWLIRSSIAKKLKKFILISCSVPYSDIYLDEDVIRTEIRDIIRNNFSLFSKQKFNEQYNEVSNNTEYLNYLINIFDDVNYDDIFAKFKSKFKKYSDAFITEIIKSIITSELYLYFNKIKKIDMSSIKIYRETMKQLVLDSNKQAVRYVKKALNKSYMNETIIVLKDIGFTKEPKIIKIETI